MTTFLSNATWYAIGAAIPAVLAEYLYRVLPGSDGSAAGWFKYIHIWIPMQLAIGYFIYKLVTATSTASLLDAFVIWAFTTTIMRVIVTVLVLHDTVKGGTWYALGLLTMARVAQTFWGR